MATRQPKLPDYQLRKLPNYGAYIGQVAAAGVGAMNKLGERTKKKQEQRDKLIKEGDALELDMMNYWAGKKKSSVNEMDETNREWAQNTASNLNTLYQKAYGSNGTKEDRNAFKSAKGAAMEDLNMLGTYANLMQKNTNAINTHLNALKVNSLVGQFTPNSMEGAANKQFEVGMNMKNGANNIQTYNDPTNNHLMISYNIADPDDPSKNKQDDKGNDIVYTDDIFVATNEFQQSGKNLDSYTIKPEQALNTQGYNTFKSTILDRGLLNTTGVQEIVTHYNKDTGVYSKKKVINKEGFLKQINSNDENALKLNAALDNTLHTSDFNTQFYQLNKEGYNVDGTGKLLPLANEAWQIGNQLSKEELKDIQTTKTYEGQTLTDPTPDDGLTREDLNAIQSQSAKMMLMDFYSNLTPEGEEERQKTDRFEYETEKVGGENVYTEGQQTKFNAKRKIYNSIINFSADGVNKYGQIYNYKDGEPTTNKFTTVSEYADYLNKINTQAAGGEKRSPIIYMTGQEIIDDESAGKNYNPDKIYKVSKKTGGLISFVDRSNFNKEDLTLPADRFYGNVMSQYDLDPEVQAYLSKPIKNQ